MTADRNHLSELAAWVLVLCAVLTTIVVVRRDLVPNLVAGTVPDVEWQARYVDGWEDALSIGIRSGSVEAPVQVVEFVDFQCPACANFEATVQRIRNRYPDQVAFTFVPFPLHYHEFAQSAQRVAECAHLQGRFEAMRSLLFEKRQTFDSVAWSDFAVQVGVEDLDQFDACVINTDSSERVERSRRLADKIGVQGTPTIIVNGWKMPAPSAEDFDKIVNNVAENRPPASDINFLATTARN